MAVARLWRWWERRAFTLVVAIMAGVIAHYAIHREVFWMDYWTLLLAFLLGAKLRAYDRTSRP